ncbi:unnamed protein product [Somion occarium]|uniref:Uncharacterized protein n=1 Tax=Somion occarium TaxID=3059160 RepID=A0ABP1E6S3_9APHY
MMDVIVYDSPPTFRLIDMRAPPFRCCAQCTASPEQREATSSTLLSPAQSSDPEVATELRTATLMVENSDGMRRLASFPSISSKPLSPFANSSARAALTLVALTVFVRFGHMHCSSSPSASECFTTVLGMSSGNKCVSKLTAIFLSFSCFLADFRGPFPPRHHRKPIALRRQPYRGRACPMCHQNPARAGFPFALDTPSGCTYSRRGDVLHKQSSRTYHVLRTKKAYTRSIDREKWQAQQLSYHD